MKKISSDLSLFDKLAYSHLSSSYTSDSDVVSTQQHSFFRSLLGHDDFVELSIAEIESSFEDSFFGSAFGELERPPMEEKPGPRTAVGFSESGWVISRDCDSSESRS